jgi:hypothetical protein
MTAQPSFYEQIPPIHSLSAAADASNYYDAPLDWLIALTDVAGSTKEIENGRYKTVNSIAAASIAALLNCTAGYDVPFVFGGDGASVLIPPQLAQAARETLLATRRLAAESFDMDLRVGLIPIEDVVAAGYHIEVARLQVSENYEQALFNGGGLMQADRLLKAPDSLYQLHNDENHTYEADFGGFECRWNAIPSKYAETLSLIVHATDADAGTTYRDVLDAIGEIYGDRDKRHPLEARKMRLMTLPSGFTNEAAIRYRDVSFRQLWQLAKSTFKARVAMWFDILGWGDYKRLFIESTDNEKFDDVLRMIISGTAQQRKRLVAYLEQQRRQSVASITSTRR